MFELLTYTTRFLLVVNEVLKVDGASSDTTAHVALVNCAEVSSRSYLVYCACRAQILWTWRPTVRTVSHQAENILIIVVGEGGPSIEVRLLRNRIVEPHVFNHK